jgi:hypothetical protein
MVKHLDEWIPCPTVLVFGSLIMLTQVNALCRVPYI